MIASDIWPGTIFCRRRRSAFGARYAPTICSRGSAVMNSAYCAGISTRAISTRFVNACSATCAGHFVWPMARLAVISASIGITCYPSDMSSPASLLRHADAALYETKRQGRDQYQAHTVALRARTACHGAAHEYMAQALFDRRLLFHYQPLVRLTHPERPVFGVEALLRWRDKEGRLRTAGDLGDSLDHPRFARDIGRLALERALSQAASWQVQGLTLRVSINISPYHLLGRLFLPTSRMPWHATPMWHRNAWRSR